MITKKEIQILKSLFSNLNWNPTIREMSIFLKQKYSQTFKLAKSLHNKEIITLKDAGKSKLISLNFSKFNFEFNTAETERTMDLISGNKELMLIFLKLREIVGWFDCILFGSYASGKNKKDSDIDLLFIIPDNSDIKNFEKNIKNKLIVHNIDINIIFEEDFFIMLSEKGKLNAANEILKNHYVLCGFEHFIKIIGRHFG